MGKILDFWDLQSVNGFGGQSWFGVHYGTAPVDTCRPQNRGSHDYLRAHKGSRRMSRPLIQESSVRVLFPRRRCASRPTKVHG